MTLSLSSQAFFLYLTHFWEPTNFTFLLFHILSIFTISNSISPISILQTKQTGPVIVTVSYINIYYINVYLPVFHSYRITCLSFFKKKLYKTLFIDHGLAILQDAFTCTGFLFTCSETAQFIHLITGKKHLSLEQ